MFDKYREEKLGFPWSVADINAAKEAVARANRTRGIGAILAQHIPTAPAVEWVDPRPNQWVQILSRAGDSYGWQAVARVNPGSGFLSGYDSWASFDLAPLGRYGDPSGASGLPLFEVEGSTSVPISGFHRAWLADTSTHLLFKYTVPDLCAIDDGTDACDWTSGSCQSLTGVGEGGVPATGGNYTGPVAFLSGSQLTIQEGVTESVYGTLSVIAPGKVQLNSGVDLSMYASTVEMYSGTVVTYYKSTLTLASGSALNLYQTTLTASPANWSLSGGSITIWGVNYTEYNLGRTLLNVDEHYYYSTQEYLSGSTLLYNTVAQTASGGSITYNNVNLTFVGSTGSGLITSGMLASGLISSLSTSTKTMTLYSGPIQATTATTIFDILDSGGVHGSLGIRQMDSKGFTGTLVGVNMFGQSGGVSVNPLASGDVVGFNIDEQTAGINCKPPFREVVLYLTATTSGAVHNTWLSKL